ncbi:MAG: multidrug DMT transporter permease [Desulfobulbaceae bacterium S3730MH12]|nr:MAG: multidrug DMT transporter permease [Desulfobulbaceae bacterium S5133MH15]OEU55044.1 MAG: multidrug DMT transporter permease [Desulfobulbaceae bacterium S3730MH12]OEU81865.1 MAG: multidrug DMT transporter permease [Desulfobulbaceae bacterium C00003063]
MSRLQANLLLTLAAVIWGSSFVVQQIGVGDLGTISFTGARFLVGALIVLPFAFRQFRRVEREERKFQRGDWLKLVITGTVLLTAAALQQHGILRTTVTNSGFLTALYVPMVPFLGLLFLKRKVHFIVWPAAICCFIGTYIMSGAQRVELAEGDLWVISSTLFWAVHVILVGAMASKTRAPLVVAAVQFTVCGIFGLILGYIVESPLAADFLGAVWGICYVGVFSVGMAFTLQVIGQRYTPAPDAAIILSSETVFAALSGMLFLGERLTTMQFMGGALIFASIIAVELLPHTRIGKARILN